MIKIHFKVTQTDVSVAEIEGKITAGNYKQILCNFDLPSEFDSLVVKASFNGELVLVENSQCFAPVLNEGHCNLGVYGYSADEDGNLELRISPSPCCLFVYPGSYDKEAAESHQPNVTVLEKLLSDIKTALNGANTATANAQDITDIVTQKLENGEFNGPPGEPGTTDYLNLLNKPTVDIDIAGITDFYFREQIPGSAKSPCFYRIVSSDDSIFQIQNVYIDENHKNEPVYEYLTVGDMLFVYDVLDETSDGYQLLSLPFVKSDVQLHFLLLSTIEDEPVQKIYYAPLSTYQQLVQLITNLNDSFNDLKRQGKLDIEQLQSQTEQKLSTKADKVSWRKIFEITTTEKVSAVEQSVDSNGKPFKLSQARIIISIPGHSGPGDVAINQPAVAYHPETDTDWYSLYGDSIGKVQAFLIFEIKAEPFVFGELTTMPNGSGFPNGSPLDKNTASVCCGGRYDIDYIDYFKLQDTLSADATFPANTKITMWGIDKND